VGDIKAARRIGPSPRAWGLPSPSSDQPSVQYGPSPRAWGLLARGGPSVPGPSVHPHARGDYGGSRRRADGGRRSIPTRVGTTPTVRRIPAGLSVHPHARGDYIADGGRAVDVHGPSPRAWGLQKLSRVGVGLIRSIPTRVGTTTTTLSPAIIEAVHPHARGDYALEETYERQPRRSIPTRVGTTATSSPSPRAPTVHPHARGDYTAAGPTHRVRGRSIPTRVGTTLRRSAIQYLLMRHGRPMSSS